MMKPHCTAKQAPHRDSLRSRTSRLGRLLGLALTISLGLSESLAANMAPSFDLAGPRRNDAWSWGANGVGQLGNNSTTAISVPVAVLRSGVLAGKSVVAVAAGNDHTVALCSDGTLAAWGENGFGELGNNSTTDSAVPVLVDRSGVLAGKTVVAIAVGNNHAVALCSDGTLAAWGVNVDGRLGNNSTAATLVPVLVDRSGVLAGKTVTSIAAGAGHTLVLCSDGTLAAWGYNVNGQVGNNSTTGTQVPVSVNQSGVLAGKTVVAIAAGDSHSLAICSDGTLAAWGRNDAGQLGNNSTVNSSVPVLVDRSGVLSGKTVTALAGGGLHTVAVCSDGTLSAWGLNASGQLGNNSTTSSSVPVLVTMAGVLAGRVPVAVGGGNDHSLALCADGTLVAWGANSNGELGNNSTTGSSVPVLASAAGLAAGERFVGLGTGLGFHSVAVVASPLAITVTVSEDSGAYSQASFATNLSAGPAGESGQTLAFNVSNDNNALFSSQPAISAGGTLSFTPALNANGTATVTLTLQDDGGTAGGGVDTSAVRTFTLTVTAVNDAPTDIALSTSSLAENNAANATVGILSTTDADAGSTFTYTLVAGTGDGDNGAFTVTGSTLTLNASANFEAKSSYSVRVRTTDQGALFFEKAFTISITDVNEAPTDLALSSTSLVENNAANAVVGTLTATDVDAGAMHTFTLVAGTGDTDNGAFNLSGNSLRLTGSADFEAKSSYSVRVRGTDNGSLTFEKPFTISITDVNEAPTDLALSASSIAENNAANAVVGTLTATDVDAGATHTFSLVTGTGDTDNGAFNIAGSSLRLTGSADFEVKSSYSVRVRGTDNGSLTFEKAFAITVTDVNEAPTLDLIANTTVTVDSGSQTIALAGISAGGPGETQTLTVTASSSAPALIPNPVVTYASPNATATLTFSPAAGSIGTATITVTVTDSGGTANGGVNVTTRAFTITVQPLTISVPANDPFAGRLAFTGYTNQVTGSTAGATAEAGEPGHAGNPAAATVWLSWTAPASGQVTFDTRGSGFDTVLAVYTGTSIEVLTLVAQNDDEQGLLTSRVDFFAIGGTNYQIAVGGFGGASGALFLNQKFSSLPVITSQPASRTVVAGTGTNVTFDVVATGTPVLTYEWLRGAAILPGATNASLTVTNVGLADAGSYQVVVSNSFGSVTSSVAVLTVASPTGNDAFAGRIAIVGETNTVTGQNLSATLEAGEPVHAGVTNGASLWWTWTAARSGLVRLDTLGSTNASGGVLDTVLAVYTGASLGALLPVAANDDSPDHPSTSLASFRAVPGTTYHIAVAGYGGVPAVGQIGLNLSQAPNNDHFTNRLVFPANAAKVRDNNVETTKETGEPNHALNTGGKSVWWSWVAPSNGLYQLSTTGSSFDTLLAVYTGSAVNGLTLVAQHDGDPADNYVISRLQFEGIGGVSYAIAIDGYEGASGDIVLNLVPASSIAANDNFADRIGFDGVNGQVRGVTALATKEPGEPNHAGYAGGKSVWWSWRAPASGLCRLDTVGSSFDTLLAVYTGTNLNALTLIAENDGEASDGFVISRLQFQAVEGTTYQFAVDGYLGASGDAVLNLLLLAAGGNDAFANRSVITGQTNMATGVNTNATKEAGEPKHAENQGGRSLWWRWVAPASSTVTIDTVGSSFDTLLSVYTGTDVSALTLVAADRQGSVNGSTVSFLAVAGVEYQIAVDGNHDGSAPAAGSVVLHVRQYPPGPLISNDDFENATPISPQVLTVRGSNLGATRQNNEPAHAGLRQGASAWWTWAALNDGSVTISTAGSEFDTVLSVYTGSSLSTLSLVAENDDPQPGASRAAVTFQATAGTVYRIAVDGYRATMGAVTLTFSPGADIPAAPRLQQLPFSQTRFVGGGGGGTNVEFRVVATGSLPLAYQWLRNGTNLDGATSSVLTLTNVSAGDAGTYQVRVSNAHGTTNSPGAELTVIGAPFNDQFANRIRIDGTSNTVRGSILDASMELNEPEHAGVPGGRSVWWKWTAPANGLVELNTIGSAFDTRLAVYTNVLGSLSLIQANDDMVGGSAPASRLFFSAIAGVEYQIAVDGYKTNGASGSVVLNLHPLVTSQTITFGPLSPKRVSDPPFTLHATASSGLPVSYASANPAVATVSGNTVTIIGAGSTAITASQPGDAIFSAADSVVQTLSVGVPPSVSLPPAGLTASTTSNASLTVTAAGTAPLSYQWRREGVDLGGATSATLTLNSVQTNQAGNYSVVITNHYGSVTSSVAVLVVERLSQTISFSAFAPGRVGDAPFAPTASASSGLLLNYSSSVPSVASVSGNMVTITGIGAATITASQPGDANFLPATSVSQTLLVGEVPSVAIPPVSVRVNVTSNAIFTVSAGGTMPLAYQWRKDGVDLSQATNSTLELSNVQTNQAGNYSVAITNLYGSVTSSVAALTVDRLIQVITFGSLPPKGLDEPAFQLGASASSGLPVSYTSSSPAVAAVSGSTVTLASFGTTTLTASQPGNAIYLPATNVSQVLTVSGTPPAVSLLQPANLVINSTSNVTFTASATGTGPLNYQWFAITPRVSGASALALTAGGFVYHAPVLNGGRGYLQAPAVRFLGGGGSGASASATLDNGTVVAITITSPGSSYSTPPAVLIDPPSGLLPDQTNSSLTIPNVGTNDTGSYFVVITNAWGSTTSSVATLTVNIPVIVTQSPTDVVAAPGSNVSFTLGVGGTLPMTIQWYWQPATGRASVAAPDVRNGFVVGATVFRGGGYYFAAPTVHFLDGNGSGATATATVTAGAVTAVNIVSPGSGYSTNAQIVIDAPAAGAPLQLGGQTNTTLSLLNVRALDAGVYFAVASNGGGSVTSAPAILQVMVPPRFTQPPQRLADGTFRLRFGPQDGGYLLASDLAAFEIWGSTNVADMNAWVRITNGISLQNGQVQVDDMDSPGLGRRFYRVLAR